MNAAVLLWAALGAAAVPPSAVPPAADSAAEMQRTRQAGRVMLGTLPLSFAAFAGVHSFGFGLRHGGIPCATPGQPQAALAFEVVLCVGLPGKVELLAAALPVTLSAIGSHTLTELRLQQGHTPWRRPSAVAAVATGSTLIAGGFAAVIVSFVAEPPVLRSGEGWGWPQWTHLVVAQSGAALMAAGGALVGTGSAHLQAGLSRRRARVRVSPSISRAPGLVVSGCF